MTVLVVVDEIFVAERDADHPLHHHRFDAVLDLGLDPTITSPPSNAATT